VLGLLLQSPPRSGVLNMVLARRAARSGELSVVQALSRN
jgi:hypothetical protein